MMGMPIGIMEKKTRVIRSPAKMLAQRRTVSESRRAKWLNSGGRFEAGDETDQVTDQNKDEDDGEKGRVGFAVMADDFPALAEHETLEGFEAVLQTSGGLDGETRS